jgi:hypothetical protein
MLEVQDIDHPTPKTDGSATRREAHCLLFHGSIGSEKDGEAGLPAENGRS